MIPELLKSFGYVKAEEQSSEAEVLAEPYLSFPCTCKFQIDLLERLEPGQAAVIECENCGASWTVVQPSLQVYPTNKFEPVWKHTSGDVPGGPVNGSDSG